MIRKRIDRHYPYQTYAQQSSSPNGHWSNPRLAQSLCSTQNPSILHMHVPNFEKLEFIYLFNSFFSIDM